MTTIKTPAPVATTIDHLDFDVLCGVRNPRANQHECTEAASWWVIASAHCIPDATRAGFMCEFHFERLMAGDMFRCATCDEREVSLERVIRTERIR